MANLMQAAVVIPVALIIIAALGGVAVGLFFNTSTTGWDASTTTIWNLLPLIGVLAIFIAILAFVGLRITGKV